MVVAVMRAWLARHKISCLATGFKELLSQHFKLTPRLACMVRYWDLARDLLLLAKNGVLGHTCLKRALDEVPEQIWFSVLKTDPKEFGGCCYEEFGGFCWTKVFFLTLFCAANLSFGHEEAFGMNKFGYLLSKKTLKNFEGSVGLRFFFLTLFCVAILSFGHKEDFGLNGLLLSKLTLYKEFGGLCWSDCYSNSVLCWNLVIWS